jgi:predicted secreted protein
MAVYADQAPANIPINSIAYTVPVQNTPARSFEIALPANPSTGYLWFLEDYNTARMKPLHHHYTQSTSKTTSAKPCIGQGGIDTWVFEILPQPASIPQITHLRFVSRRVHTATPRQEDMQKADITVLLLE